LLFFLGGGRIRQKTKKKFRAPDILTTFPHLGG
jgi:hypothetical protein